MIRLAQDAEQRHPEAQAKSKASGANVTMWAEQETMIRLGEAWYDKLQSGAVIPKETEYSNQRMMFSMLCCFMLVSFQRLGEISEGFHAQPTTIGPFTGERQRQNFLRTY